MPHRNQKFSFKKTLKGLSCTAAIAPVLSGAALNLALPVVSPHVVAVQAQTTTFITQLQQMQLTASDFRNIVCLPYFSIWSQVLSGADSLENLCAYLVAQPGFYDQQVRTYEMRVIDSNGTYRSFYVYNLYGAMHETPPLGTSFTVLPPTSRSYTGIRGLNYSSNPTISATYTYASTNQERLTMPIPPFTYPSWFVNRAQSQPYLSVFATDYSALRVAGASNQITGTPVHFIVLRTGSLAQALSIPYTLSGSATLGTDYQFVTPFPHPTSPQTNLYISAGEYFASYFAQGFGVQNSVPEETIQLAAQLPSGYSQGPALSDFGWFGALYIPSVTFTANSATTIQPGDSTTFTITRSGAPTAEALEVYYTLGGTASNGSDYSYLDGSTTIPAGQASATVTLTVPARTGSQAIPAESITINPTDTNTYNPSAGLSYEIAAYNPSTISVTASESGTIQRGTSGSFTVTRSAAESSPLIVNYSLGGTATPGSDYLSPTGTGTTGSITIPAGQLSATIPVSVPAASGSQTEPQETIVLTVETGQGYSSTASSTLTIAAYTLQTVSLPAQGIILTPGGTTDSVTITRSGDPSSPLTVALTTGGTATPGVDYGQLPATVTIPAGAISVTVPLRAFPQSGSQAEPQETVTLAIAPGNGYSPSTTTPITYTIPAYSPTAAPTVTVSIPANGDTTLNPGETTGVTFTRTGDIAHPLPVNYRIGGTADNGTDYSQLDGDVVIPAGESTATVQIRIPSDIAPSRDGRTLTIDLAPGTGYANGTNTRVTYTLNVPAPLMAAPESEPLGVVVRVVDDTFVIACATGACPEDIPMTITTGGSALPGTDYRSLDQTITVPAGSEGIAIPVTILPEATGGRTIALELDVPDNVALVSAQPYVIEVPVRTPHPLLILTPAVDENIPGFTVSRPAGSHLTVPLTLTYSVGGTAIASEDYRALPGTITIPAGQTRAEIPVHIKRGATAGRVIHIEFNEPPAGYLFSNTDPLTLRLSRELIDQFTHNGEDHNNGNDGNQSGDTGDHGEDDSSNSSDSAFPVLTGVAGLGGLTALATGAATGEVSQCPATDIPVGLMNLVEELGIPVASIQPVAGTTQIATEQVHHEPDWTAVSFSLLPAVNGTPADQSFTLGMLEGLNQNITLAELMGESSYTLISSGLVGNATTLGALAQTLYAGADRIGDVEGLAEYLAEHSGGNVEAIAAVSMDRVRSTPQLANLDLRQLPLAQVPGLSAMELDELPNWQQLPVARVPGMSRAPFSQLFPCLGRNNSNEQIPRRNEGNDQ